VPNSPLEYYRNHGVLTSPGARRVEFCALPQDIAALSRIVQGLLIHRDIAPVLYDVKLPPERYPEANSRPVAVMLAG
jgi:hypothetical protein